MKHLSAALIPALLFPAIAQAQSVFDLDEIVFSAGLTEQEAARVGVSVDVITEDELAEAGDIPLAEYLATLPGVSVTRNGPPGSNAIVRIRGAGQGLIAVLIDGIAVNDPTGTNGQFAGFGGLTTGALRRVEVLRGSQSAIYGSGAVNGVIAITTVANGTEPEGTMQSFGLEGGSYQTLSTDYGLIQRQGPLTLSFGLTHWQSGGFSAADEDAGNTETDSARTSRLSFGAIYDFSPDITIGANAFFQTAEADFDEFVGLGPADGTPGDETGGNETFGFRLFGEYRGTNWTHKLSGTFLELERRLSSVTVADPNSTPFASVFNGDRRAVQYLATSDAITNTNLSFGLDWHEERGSFTGLTGGTRSISVSGAFGEAIIAVNPNIDIFTSLRHQENSAFGAITTGRLAFSYRASETTTLRGAVANGYRAPALSELYGTFPVGGGQVFTGNANLQPENSVSYELGIDRKLAGEGMLSATLFQLEVDNFIQYQDCTRANVAPFACITGATNANIVGVSRFQGLELSASLPISQSLTVSGAYTYTDARSATNDRIARVPMHDLALALDAELGGNWSNSTTLRRVYDIFDRAPSAFGPGTRGDDYTTVDTTFSYALNDSSEAYLRVENLFDEEYQTINGFGTSDRAFYLGLRSRF